MMALIYSPEECAVAVATVANISQEEARDMLAVETVAGAATLARVLAGPLYRPYPIGMKRGSDAWRAWCESAEIAETVAGAARAVALKKNGWKTEADRVALKAMALRDLELLDEEVRLIDADYDAAGMADVRRAEEREARGVIRRLDRVD